jgi:hypothetical protein
LEGSRLAGGERWISVVVAGGFLELSMGDEVVLNPKPGAGAPQESLELLDAGIRQSIRAVSDAEHAA